MRTRSDMEVELLARLQVASNSTAYPSSRITSLVKEGYIWATQLFIWLDLVEGKKSHTVASQENYNYPTELKSSSIFMLTVNDEVYERKNFEDYLKYKLDNPTSNLKIFANFKRQIFIHPVPSDNGSNNLKVWGSIQASSLSSSTDTTIFTDNKEEGNEAIVRKAFSVAIKRTDQSLSKAEEIEAVAILSKLNQDEWKSTYRDQRLNRPMFSVPDYFQIGVGGLTPYGKFSYDPSQV